MKLCLAGVIMAAVFTLASFWTCFTRTERVYLLNVMKSFFK
jgi:hypothetical protein